MTIKVDRINTQIQREISLILQNEVRDRDLRMCTITAVETTNDLSIAKIYVTFLNSSSKKGLDALQRSNGYIRNLLAKKLKIRKCPELHFVLDTSLEYGNKIESILKELHNKENH
ncbi:30S ribosome-binding factor RbfA [[Clostridium] spiroforme]|nr:30S ribosome-binding factor RbfA [Thomasclavelia spiroformis]MBM6880397.1 30S ribosome-binding factor RbfA [Thomasclavelia spiroformis]MBM6930478.1 30S ribosome-binding factor RbfA [Thomasclavelia spiroformis]